MSDTLKPWRECRDLDPSSSTYRGTVFHNNAAATHNCTVVPDGADDPHAELAKLRAEVAALKARKVTLPQRFAIDAVEGHDRSGYPEAQLEIEASASGAWIHYSETADAIRAAGIEVEP